MSRLITATAAGYAALGIAGLAVPSRIPQSFGGTADTPDARTELRAVYGGLPLAIAGSLLVRPASARPMALLTAGFGIARAASIGIEGEANTSNRALVAVELGGALALLLGARRDSRRATSAPDS